MLGDLLFNNSKFNFFFFGNMEVESLVAQGLTDFTGATYRGGQISF